MGRFFASWAIIYLLWPVLLKNAQAAHIFGLLFSQEKSFGLLFTKKNLFWLHFLGDFSTKSSGHPEHGPLLTLEKTSRWISTVNFSYQQPPYGSLVVISQVDFAWKGGGKESRSSFCCFATFSYWQKKENDNQV
jgi:hypothetical protein